jgi:sensor histidine kinase YesM
MLQLKHIKAISFIIITIINLIYLRTVNNMYGNISPVTYAEIILNIIFISIILNRGNLIQKEINTLKQWSINAVIVSLYSTLLIGIVEVINKKASTYDIYTILDNNIKFAFIFFELQTLSIIYYISNATTNKTEEKAPQIIYEQNNQSAELYKLRQQINPHFLFNSLNSINALMQFDQDKARKMIVNLSQYYRNTINNNDLEWNTVSREIEDIKLYTEIEKIRFGHRLNIEITCDESLLAYKIPPLLYQPLVENAIKHGLYGTLGAITIQIKVYKTLSTSKKSYITFEIQNPFDHTIDGKAEGAGVGIENIRQRMYILFGTHSLYKTFIKKINEENSMYYAFISIPLNE